MPGTRCALPLPHAGEGWGEGARVTQRLALFDLDHTLLSGDSDVLWCEFLMEGGILDRASFEPRNAEMARRYRDASVSAEAFCEFYVATLAGRTLAAWQPWCARFLAEIVAPRIPAAARALVEAHRARGDRLVLTTATNRVLTELTAQHLRIDELIATEVELVDGVCTGRTRGTLNMREGKVARLRAWLDERGLAPALLGDAVFYSDSSNELPLLRAVGEPIAVDPDPGLRAQARLQGWQVLELAR
jgi:HAD superfamily hydrolase (TIGR01490 family)